MIGPIDVRRPELRGDICAVIGMVCHGHVGGELRLPVSQLVRMLGVSLAPELKAQLEDRGDLCFSGEGFTNVGPVIRRDIRVMGMAASLEVAGTLRGTVERGSDRFSLRFESGSSFSVARFVFETELDSLDVDPVRVTLRFRPGAELRIHLVEGPEPMAGSGG